MGRAKNFKSLYQWCIENGNDNLLKNWNYEKNGDITPHDVARKSSVKIHFTCHVCGTEYYQKLADIRCKTGCYHCRGNKYVDLGRNGDYTVYCHKCPNGKMYIGFTGLRLCNRFNPRLYKWNKRFVEDIEKYGWDNIEHIVLESNLTREEASDKEAYYIELYKTRYEEYGYNICTGGIHGGYHHEVNEETRRKISQSQIGKVVSEEARRHMSLSHIGKDNHKSKKVYKTDKDGRFIEEYNSIKEAAEKNGCNYTNLSACLTGRRKTYLGYLWKYSQI